MIETLSSPSSPETDGYVEWSQFPQPPLGFPRGEAAERSEADEGWRELESSKIPVEWYKTETNAIYPAAFINKPVAAPHQAFLPIGSEVPLAKKSSFPPGEAKRRLREPIPFNVPIHSGNGGLLKIPIIYKLFTHAIVLPGLPTCGTD